MPNQTDPNQTGAVPGTSKPADSPVVPDFIAQSDTNIAQDNPAVSGSPTVVSPVVPPIDYSSGSSAPPDLPPMVSAPKKKFGGGRIIATILGILLLVGGVGTGVYLTQQQQIFKQKAATPTPTPVPKTYYIDFDHYPNNSTINGTVSNGTSWPGTVLTNQYASFGATFSSTHGGPIDGIGAYREAKSSPNFLVGNPDSFQPITVNIVDPSTGNAATASSVSVTLISVGDATVTAKAFASDLTTVIKSVSVTNSGTGDGRYNKNDISLTGPGIARVTFTRTNLNSGDGFGIDDLYISFAATETATPTPIPTSIVCSEIPSFDNTTARIVEDTTAGAQTASNIDMSDPKMKLNTVDLTTDADETYDFYRSDKDGNYSSTGSYITIAMHRSTTYADGRSGLNIDSVVLIDKTTGTQYPATNVAHKVRGSSLTSGFDDRAANALGFNDGKVTYMGDPSSSLTLGFGCPSTPTTPTPTATATSTPTVTPTPTVTATATPTNAPNSCGGTCGSNSNCNSDLICYNGYCRNPSCTGNSNCVCSTATAVPTATANTSTAATTQPTLPQSGTDWPTMTGIGIGLFTIIGSLLLAL